LLLQQKLCFLYDLLRKSTVVQNHMIEVNVAVLWGELHAVW